MNATLAAPIAAATTAAAVHDCYLVTHGKSAALGSFLTPEPMCLRRGERVVVATARGQEVGEVLCPAGVRQQQLLGAGPPGLILRLLTEADEARLEQLRERAEGLFEESVRLVRELDLPLEILDVDMLLDDQAVLQFLGSEAVDVALFAQTLEQRWAVRIRLENLAAGASGHGASGNGADEHERGCGKPDCGRTSGGGCTSCGEGGCASGGCSSCGSTGVDLRAYFAHLRSKMEESRRLPLV